MYTKEVNLTPFAKDIYLLLKLRPSTLFDGQAPIGSSFQATLFQDE